RRHRSGRHEDHRQVAEGKRADQHAGDDLVAYPEADRRIEHLMAERDRRGHGDHVAGKQAQLHARLALCDAVAHRGNPAGELCAAAGGKRGLLDPDRIPPQRLVRREHVVVGGHDGQVGPFGLCQPRLGLRGLGRQGVGQVGACQPGALCLSAIGGTAARQVAFAGGGTAGQNARSHGLDNGMKGHGCLRQRKWADHAYSIGLFFSGTTFLGNNNLVDGYYVIPLLIGSGTHGPPRTTPAPRLYTDALMNTSILPELRARLPSLSRAAARVARLAIAHPGDVARMTIGEIARAAEVSEPTVIRFCRALGLAGWPDFKVRLAASLMAGGVPYVHSSLKPDESVAGLAGKVFDNAVSALLR